MANAPDNTASQTHIAQLLAPPGITDRSGLAGWISKVLPGAEQLTEPTTVTGYEIADEQLLPHRAAKFQGRYTVLFEAPSLGALQPLLTGTAEGPEVEGGGLVVFRQIFETRTPTVLPDGAVPPKRDNPQGPPGVFLAWTRPVSAAADADYNRWYNDWHCPETLHMEGFVRGRRFRKVPEATAAVAIPDVDAPYLTLYEVANTAAVPFARDVLLPWLATVGVDHLGPESYDRGFTQAFIFTELDGDAR